MYLNNRTALAEDSSEHSNSLNAVLKLLPNTHLEDCLLQTDCVDISIPLINLKSYQRQELCCVTVFTEALPWIRAAGA
jgi:hypothetical protein